MEIFNNSWDAVMKDEFDKPYYRELERFLRSEYEGGIVYPGPDEIWNAMRLTPYEDVKVVILGQDPYHGEGQAHGLAFSVRPGVKQPPSLKNIFKELSDDVGIEPPSSDYGCLTCWAEQGVLLLNTCLTVQAHKAGSHRGKGWETFTDAVIKKLNSREDPVIFILWGANAKSKKKFIDLKKNIVLEGPHPSPLSAYRGFFGGKYFSKTNKVLKKIGKEPINWDVSKGEI